MEDEKTLKDKRIQTAVNFLQNPKVRGTPLERKRAFLEKKGLSKDEIDKAIELSGALNDEVVQTQVNHQPRQSSLQPVTAIPPRTLWRDYLFVAVLGGGVGYGVVHLFKAYFLPWLFKSKSEEQDLQFEKINRSVQELKDNMLKTVGEVQTTVSSMQKSFDENQALIKTLTSDLASTKSKLSLMTSETCNLTDLKSELTSVKGLLLGRRQFPSPSLPASPAIPAWQRSSPLTKTETASNSPLADTVQKLSDQLGEPSNRTPEENIAPGPGNNIPEENIASGPENNIPEENAASNNSVTETVAEPAHLVNGDCCKHLVNGTFAVGSGNDTDTSSDDTTDTVMENVRAPGHIVSQEQSLNNALVEENGEDNNINLTQGDNVEGDSILDESKDNEEDSSMHCCNSDTSLSSMSSDLSSVNLSAEATP